MTSGRRGALWDAARAMTYPVRLALLAAGALSGLGLLLGVARAGAHYGHLVTRSSPTTVLVDDSGSNAGFCPGGTSVVSGGFSNSFDALTSRLFVWGTNPVLGPRPFGPAWRTTEANLGRASSGHGAYTAFAYCDRRQNHLLRMVTKTTRVGPHRQGAMTVQCPEGSVAIAGGFSDAEADLHRARLFGIKSKRKGERGWRAVAYNKAKSTAGKLIVIAECDKKEPRLTTESAATRVPVRATSSVAAQCGDQRQAVSGGFATSLHRSSDKGAFPLASMRAGEDMWQGAAFGDRASGSLRVFAYCER